MIRRWLLGWLLLYAVLTFFPFPLNLLPGLSWLDGAYHHAMMPAARVVGRSVGLRVEALPAGSGDTAFNYALLIMNAAAAAVGASVLAALRLADGRTLAALLRVHLRYALGSAMLSYGLAKVLVQQFPAPDAERMLTTFGESSPMGLLWTCLGHAPGYTIMGGVLECLGGLLLLWRQTTCLGAVVLIPVMTNVVAMNFFYDVPVKIYSTHLLLAAIVLVVPDAGRLTRALLGSTVPSAGGARPVEPGRPWARRVRPVGKIAVLAAMTLALWAESVSEGPWDDGEAAAASALLPPDGSYRVIGGAVDASAAGSESPAPWRIVTFAQGRLVSVRLADGSRRRYRVEDGGATHQPRRQGEAGDPWEGDAAEGVVWLAPFGRPAGDRRAWLVRRAGPGLWQVRAEDDGRDVLATLRPVSADEFYLPRRGFRWVIEAPDNR